MAGRITYRNGRHPSRIGRMVEGVTLDKKSLEGIADLIGRGLTAAEIDDVEEWLAEVKDIKNDSDDVRVRDTAETLGSLLREDDRQLIWALDDVDGLTEAEIIGKLFKVSRIQNPYAATPEQLREAVELARKTLRKDRAGRRTKDSYRLYFATVFCALWREWTGEQPRTSASRYAKVSPAIRCAAIFLAAIGDRVTPSIIAKLIQKTLQRSRQNIGVTVAA